MTFDPEFASGSTVYFRLSGDPGIVTGFELRYPRKMVCVVLYLVTWGEDKDEGKHYGFELTDTKPIE
jgi:hypothetical protein